MDNIFFVNNFFTDLDYVEKLLGENSNIIKVCKKIINKEDVVHPL